MKRAICLLLTLALLLPAFALGETLDLREYKTVAEKFLRQTQENGLSGSMELAVSGEGSWVKDWSFLNGVTMTTYARFSSVNKDVFRYDLYAHKDGQRAGETVLFGDGQRAYLQSALLMNSMYSLPLRGDLLSTLLTDKASGNPALWSLAWQLVTMPQDIWESEWEPLIAPLRQQMEFWMESWAGTPQTASAEDGSTLLLFHYDIPAEALRQEIKELLHQALADARLMALLQAQMSDEQAGLYLNSGYQWYFDRVIDGLNLGTGITMDRQLTTMGELRLSQLVLPLRQEGLPYEQLLLSESPKQRTVRLSGPEQTVELLLGPGTSDASGSNQNGFFRYIPKDGMAVSLAWRARSVVQNYTDEEGVEHEMTTWLIELNNDMSHLAENDPSWHSYMTVEPITLRFRTHFYSERGKTMRASLEVAAILTLSDGTVNLKSRFGTRNSDDLELPATESAIDISGWTLDKRAGLGGDLLANALAALQALNPPPTPEPTAVPTPEPTPEPTEEPTPAPTEEPTPAPTEAPTEEPAEEPTADPLDDDDQAVELTDAPAEDETGEEEQQEEKDGEAA